MLRAMDSAVAGLRSHQNKLDVISNNIANVNTYGYKSQNYTFKDTMYQTSTASTGGSLSTDATDGTGGTNAAQFGYGSLTGSIATDFTSSTPSYVGGFNASINGSGFFVTSSTYETEVESALGSEDTTVSNNLISAGFHYTRVGQFNVDSNGFIVDANGNFVYGFRPDDVQNPTDDGYSKTLQVLMAPASTEGATFTAGSSLRLGSVEIGNTGIIKATATDTAGKSVSIVLGKVAIANFQNQQGLTKAGNNSFVATSGDNTGSVSVNAPGSGTTPDLMAGYLEASNVDLAKEFSDMITTQRGFQANSKIITVSDEVLQELVNMKR